MKTLAKILLTLLPLVTLLTLPVAVNAQTQWRSVEPNNAVLMTLPHGKVVIELAPQFSPKHVKQFSQLVNDGVYTNNKFYRVIDGFVAQGGPGEEITDIPTLDIENEWSTDTGWAFTKVQDKDLFAEQTGFKDGFAIGYNPSEKKAWLTHCPGVLAMARENEPNSATSHFYFTIGQAPRYLDRIMTVFGRVVYGMHNIQAIQRTQVIEGDTGILEDNYTTIVDIQLMSALPKDQQLNVEVEVTESKAFVQKLDERRARSGAFFYKKPPAVLDVCQVPVSSRLVIPG
jgi:peptidylprolyl isomerase